MSEREVFIGIIQALARSRDIAPIDTGNLRYNSIKLRPLGQGRYRIYIDEAVAPYAPYTVEPWKSPKWNGAKNPNEGWWNDFAKSVINEIKRITGGTLKND